MLYDGSEKGSHLVQLFGKEGSPAAVLIPGGKLGMDAERDRAKDLARRGTCICCSDP